MKNFYCYDTEIGKITIADNGVAVTNVAFGAGGNFLKANTDYYVKETDLISRTIYELNEYLKGGRKYFSVPVYAEGAPFRKKVWDALLTIPYGETKSYKQIAAETGNVKACRAVGSANNKNPAAILIPCHRVIGADGSLTGYAGGLEVKQRLLDLEKYYVSR